MPVILVFLIRERQPILLAVAWPVRVELIDKVPIARTQCHVGDDRAQMLTQFRSLRTTPAVALGIAERAWTIGDLIDAALATLPTEPVVTGPDRRRRLRVINGGKG